MAHVNYGAHREGDLKICRDKDKWRHICWKIEWGKILVFDRAGMSLRRSFGLGPFSKDRPIIFEFFRGLLS